MFGFFYFSWRTSAKPRAKTCIFRRFGAHTAYPDNGPTRRLKVTKNCKTEKCPPDANRSAAFHSVAFFSFGKQGGLYEAV